ncbi:MAG: hypothetical protein R3B66_00460 [Candidatus Scalinduaceae bacterium]
MIEIISETEISETECNILVVKATEKLMARDYEERILRKICVY